MTTKQKQKNIMQNGHITASMNNYMLNILIFLLLTVIIYLGYSLFIKFSNNSKSEIDIRTTQKPAEIIQLEVLNGCGVSGVADRYTDFLRSNNIDVVKSGNYIQFDVDETIVIDRIGNKSNALYVASLLNVKEGNAITQINNDYFVDVTVIIGRDYFKQSPIKKD
ncbi:MAG: LytR C-terminal domain-containing protein [Bacteroidetes bacterium]|nr:LytR C-terminal domain-containing protein [Bacteroidota bacterium]MBU1115538.1 LytR C-terminal domain-containing protein [Bacteroidota bacterium]MBU1797694.1 LytR C-terminal domain-containing protein [Bacteroidota bacterium]